MKSDRSTDQWLDVLMSYLLPFGGVAIVVPALLKTSLPPWAAWGIGIPAGVSAGWVVSLFACGLLTVLTRRL